MINGLTLRFSFSPAGKIKGNHEDAVEGDPVRKKGTERRDEQEKQSRYTRKHALLFWIQKREKEIAVQGEREGEGTELCDHPKVHTGMYTIPLSSCLSFHSLSSAFDPFD